MNKKIPHDIPVDFLRLQTILILASYEKWFDTPLVPPGRDLQETMDRLFFAPFAVVSSNAAKDPLLNYGNEKALKLWELPWKTLTRTPGSQTAEPMHREERQKFLDTVQKDGFINNYSGIRISSTGQRFKIRQAQVWNLVDASGKFYGQAATFSDWEFL